MIIITQDDGTEVRWSPMLGDVDPSLLAVVAEMRAALEAFVAADERNRANMLEEGGEDLAGAIDTWPELVAGRAALSRIREADDA